ncbi:tRNA glutamyl-Q(34) synthetase GluQRS [Marinobacter sp.]|uniref:tRNA glutamyl-Q(34) synthetase GluQRS n=1 Tax=Marinobacter sp. TaxID=50741 RepID=UPI0019BF6F28|nr:tRNA glutamyl-Q(34) synthetase GluQRS [Marinobacter sp.]MBD3656055.1 tRNA glutamyl-Q(34) synthetase GluQRS [Marinobacter sp.]
MTANPYRGRFAPSPTGPLHFGSLVTALASFLEARIRSGTWLVRIEDLDPLREPADAADRILHSLQVHQLISDEPIRFQSRRHAAYHAAIASLISQHKAYRCRCSRKQLLAHGGRHPDHCRTAHLSDSGTPCAIRFALEDERSEWQDELLGPQHQWVRPELDDPVLLRKEGFFAYQLAVVVDDIDQGITDVVRGSDLLGMTAQQQQLFRALGHQPPRWLHIPVILNAAGQKLSKQNQAPALDDTTPAANLTDALQALGQQPPAELRSCTPAEILAWAVRHWRRDAIPRHPHQAPGCLTDRQHN